MSSRPIHTGENQVQILTQHGMSYLSVSSYSSFLTYHSKTDGRWIIDNNLRVTKEELDRMNRTSVQLADGSGDYLATLGELV